MRSAFFSCVCRFWYFSLCFDFMLGSSRTTGLETNISGSTLIILTYAANFSKFWWCQQLFYVIAFDKSRSKEKIKSSRSSGFFRQSRKNEIVLTTFFRSKYLRGVPGMPATSKLVLFVIFLHLLQCQAQYILVHSDSIIMFFPKAIFGCVSKRK